MAKGAGQAKNRQCHRGLASLVCMQAQSASKINVPSQRASGS
jgi:hypothetical protein